MKLPPDAETAGPQRGGRKWAPTGQPKDERQLAAEACRVEEHQRLNPGRRLLCQAQCSQPAKRRCDHRAAINPEYLQPSIEQASHLSAQRWFRIQRVGDPKTREIQRQHAVVLSQTTEQAEPVSTPARGAMQKQHAGAFPSLEMVQTDPLHDRDLAHGAHFPQSQQPIQRRPETASEPRRAGAKKKTMVQILTMVS